MLQEERRVIRHTCTDEAKPHLLTQRLFVAESAAAAVAAVAAAARGETRGCDVALADSQLRASLNSYL